MKPVEIRAGRLRTILQHASKVESRQELVDFAIARFAVSTKTAEDYITTVIKLIERQQNKGV